MSIEVRVPTLLQKTVGGAKVVRGEGFTIVGLLNDLDRQYPGFKEKLVMQDGQLHKFVNIYVNDEDIRYLEKENTPIKDGDTISIVPSIAGGRNR